jgi:MoaA/NifB/PqqE/SkfB family radical SAM enzyme
MPTTRWTRPSMEAWTFSNEELAEASEGARLLNPSLDLSNACNLNCSFCFVEDLASSAKTRRPGELTLAESFAVLDDFASAGARTVNLVGAGEPTIDPHFLDIVRRIHSHGMRTMLFTNGISIGKNPLLAQELASLNVSVCLKLNSKDPERQDRIVGRRGYARQRDAALEALLAAGLAREQPTRLGVDVLVIQEALSEIPDLYAWCIEANIFPLLAEYIPTGRTAGGAKPLAPFDDSAMSRLSQEQRMALAKRLAGIDHCHGLSASAATCAYFGGTVCTQLLGVYVDIMGRVWPCVARTQRQPNGMTASHEPLGSVRATGQTAALLWSSHPYMAFLRTTYSGSCPYKLAIPSIGIGFE